MDESECRQIWPQIEDHLQFCAGRVGEPQLCQGFLKLFFTMETYLKNDCFFFVFIKAIAVAL
jgi:hypothetical protein